MFYDEETQKRYWRNGIIAVASVFLLFGIVAALINSSSKHPSEEVAEQPSSAIEQHEEKEKADEKVTKEPVEEKEKTPVKKYKVISVTDGDTIRIDYDGVSTPLRIIGIDTPETVDSRKVVQCFGEEASNYLKNKLTNKEVSIEADPTQSDRDKYDRLLRYVYLDGEDVGLSIIKNGYGHEYTYNIPYQKQSEYKAAEKSAESQNLGLWSPSTCAGDTEKAAKVN